MRRRRYSAQLVLEQGTESRPGFDPRIPVLGAGVLVPRDVAKIVDAGQMRGGRDIAERELVTGQPIDQIDSVAWMHISLAEIAQARLW